MLNSLFYTKDKVLFCIFQSDILSSYLISILDRLPTSDGKQFFIYTRVVRKVSGKRFLREISMPAQPDNLKIHLRKRNGSIRFGFEIQNEMQIF